jgi:orotate phosphoribosyltransferase
MIEQLRRSGLLGEREAARFAERGHFAYEGGEHGDTWLALDRLFADPRRLQRAVARLADELAAHDPDVVCGPLAGGALVAQWLAWELGAAFVYAEAQPNGCASGRPYVIPAASRSGLANRRVVVADDVIDAGSAVRACIGEVEGAGGSVVAVASLIARDRPPEERDLGLPVTALATVAWTSWPASECPLCKSGQALGPSP